MNDPIVEWLRSGMAWVVWVGQHWEKMPVTGTLVIGGVSLLAVGVTVGLSALAARALHVSERGLTLMAVAIGLALLLAMVVLMRP
jgi:hypothetical protein